MNHSDDSLTRHPSSTRVDQVPRTVRRHRPEPVGLRWDGVPVKQYKETGTHFRNITRQVLFGEADGLNDEVRYFEVWPDGHSTLERHEHVHAVIIIHGRGGVLVGDEVHPVAPFDLVSIPAQTWHQFRAAPDESLGFLCLVPCDRDRPVRPTEKEARALRSSPVVDAFVRL